MLEVCFIKFKAAISAYGMHESYLAIIVWFCFHLCTKTNCIFQSKIICVQIIFFRFPFRLGLYLINVDSIFFSKTFCQYKYRY